MAVIKISSTTIVEQAVESIALLVEKNFEFTPALKEVEKKLFPALEVAFKRQNFKGNKGSSFTMSISNEGKVQDLVFVGLGEFTSDHVIGRETYRRALGTIVRSVEARRSKSLAILLPDAALFGINDYELAKLTTLTLLTATYHFDEYITDADRRIKDLVDIELVPTASANREKLEAGVHDGTIIAESLNVCRHWIDLPPEKLTPLHLADVAQTIAEKYGIKITRFNEKEVCNMGMGGLCGVSKGSERDCELVIMEYHGNPGGPTLGFVGKGITFDSGGLSIKPALHMETMKEDMSGAAAVISSIKAIARLKLPINIVAIAPLSENLPSGKATKPGDIVTFYNGKTAEVKNTDAEGRLILADALSYAVKHYKLDALIDLATLTGACAYALGPHFSGMMSQHDDLVAKVISASDRSGDKVWRLPLPDDYKVAIKSTVADICNIGSPKYLAGATTAALFLQNFVDDVPWVHLDIAGTAFDVPDISYYRPDSATGVGVRLLVELAANWK